MCKFDKPCSEVDKKNLDFRFELKDQINSYIYEIPYDSFVSGLFFGEGIGKFCHIAIF